MSDDAQTDLPGPCNEGREESQAWGVTPAFDAKKYSAHLDDVDLTEEEKLAFLQTVWFIMAAFVDLGFRVDSVTTILTAFAEASSKAESNGLQEGNSSGAAQRKERSHEP